MDTKIYSIYELNEKTLSEIDEAAAIIRNGGLVAFPTETVYGLGANALNPEAVASIYRAKGRPSDNPLIVHVAGADDCRELTPLLSPAVTRLIDRFWPGPLTLVVPKTNKVPDITTGDLKTVAIRMPDNPVALELIRRSGCPIAAPSANISGRPSPTRGEHVVHDMDGRIDAIIKSSDCRVGIESTVLDMTGDVPAILRPGILTPEEIGAVLGVKVIFDPAIIPNREQIKASGSDKAADIQNTPAMPDEILIPKAPGMKYTHYAPKAEMIIVRGAFDKVLDKIDAIKTQQEAESRKVGVVMFREDAFIEAAHDFFAELRVQDDKGVDLILAGALDDNNSVGFAVMNRMLKSAGYNIIDV